MRVRTPEISAAWNGVRGQGQQEIICSQRGDVTEHADVIALNLKNRGRPKFLVIHIYNGSKSEATRALRDTDIPGIQSLFRVVQVRYKRCENSAMVIGSQVIDPDHFFLHRNS